MSIDIEQERPKFEAVMLAEGKMYKTDHGIWAYPGWSATDLFHGWLSAKRDSAAERIADAGKTIAGEDLAASRAECERLAAENASLLRGEFICTSCGLRKNAEPSNHEDF